MINQEDLDFASELGELVGAAVCSVVDYIQLNSRSNEKKVLDSLSDVAKKLVEVA